MIQINIDVGEFTHSEQMNKITEEYKEVLEDFKICANNNFSYINMNDKLISECFDLIQATNQLIRMMTNEQRYKDLYKVHLKKLQGRAEEGKIKIKEYLEV